MSFLLSAQSKGNFSGLNKAQKQDFCKTYSPSPDCMTEIGMLLPLGFPCGKFGKTTHKLMDAVLYWRHWRSKKAWIGQLYAS